MQKELLEKLKQSLEQEKIAMEKELETFATEDKKKKEKRDTKNPNFERESVGGAPPKGGDPGGKKNF